MELTGLLTAVLIFISCCFFIFSTWNTMYRKRGLPPGPRPLPLIGNLLNIEMGSMVNSLVKFGEQYGSVYTLYFGSTPIIVISGYEAIKEALIDYNDEFGGRGKLATIDQFTKGYGLIFTNGERWKLMRTFTLKTLRDFGLGKRSNKWKIQEEARCVVQEFRKYQGCSLNTSKIFMEAFSNILCSILFGDRYDYKDERFTKLLYYTQELFRVTSSTWGQVQSILPTLMTYIPGPHHKAVSFSEEIVEFVAEIVKSCQQTLDLSKPRHFVDSFLIKMEQEKNDPNTEFNMKNLLYTIHNLFVAATESLSTTLQHALLLLLKYSEVQDKLHEEIDRVLGRDRMGTDVYTLLWTVHRDRTQFATPYKFNPNHFLDENGKFKKNDAFMAFSVGKRSCPGEGLARMELFIFLTTILQNFTLTSKKEFSEAEVAPKLKGFLNVPIEKRGLPPGPTPLPLIGNLLNIKMGSLVNSLVQLGEQYGSVYTLYFGSNPIIVISGYEAIKEALIDHNDEFGGRGKLATIDQFTKGYGLSLSNGERWKIIRTFTFKTLRDFGLGKRSNEWKIQEEARYVVQEFRKNQGRPLNPSNLFMKAVSNILCSILFGDRYDYTDERFTKLLHYSEEIFRLTSSPWGQVQSILPTLMSYIPGPHLKAVTFSEEMVEFVAEIVKSCQKTLDLSKPRHFVDCFLIKMEQEKNDPNTEFTMKNLLVTIHNLFLAATETLNSTLRHALLVLLKHPDIEDKLHEEIDRVLGRDRIVNMDDKTNMPYTQAVIHEVQRFCDIAPFNVPHMVTTDTMFRGYHIPKGTDIYTLLWTVHRDRTQFATPYKFNPNHFLDENGKFKKNDAFMAFSVGKRSCPGENVARMELFIFFTTILQNFTLTSKKEFSEAEVAPKLKGFLNVPIAYELSFIPR